MAKSVAALAEERVAGLLGRTKAGSAAHVLIPALRTGLAYRSVAALAKFLDAPIEELAVSIGVPRRTLDRRKAEGRLDARTSEKVARLARVAARAEQVLGDVAAMRRWLRTPNRALGMVTPLSMLDMDLGAEAVLDVLGRLEHGVYS